MAGYAYRARLVALGLLAAGMLAAVLASGAQASFTLAQCAGGPIGGQGAAVEKVAMTAWTSDFNKNTKAKSACAGKQGSKETPLVSYLGNSSGAGLRSFGAETKKPEEIKFGPTNGFVGTGEAPNAKQSEEIIKQETPETPGTLETLPTTQLAMAIYANLPTGCTATGGPVSGRLVLNNSTLQGIFAGTIKTWGGITDSGESLTPGTCGSEPITVVVRGEKAATTNIVKKYFGLINTGKLVTAEGEKTWDELSEGKPNVTWPTALNLVKTKVEGDEAVANLVAATPGSIGYSNLAELRTTGLFSPATPSKFWFEIENATKGKGETIKYSYQDPSSNGDVAGAADANCKKTAYTNGKNPFPPPSVTGLWNEVTTSAPEAASPLKEKTYPLCNFAYVLAFTKYSLFSTKGATEGEARSVHDFLAYVAEKKGGQATLLGNDYYGEPKNVLTELTAGAAAVEF